MNTIIKSGILFLSIFLFSNFSAQTKSFKARVEGNCGMCKERIETAAKSDKNVKSADWSMSKKVLTVSYDASRTDKIYPEKRSRRWSRQRNVPCF
jgi:hypothetical protein